MASIFSRLLDFLFPELPQARAERVKREAEWQRVLAEREAWHQKWLARAKDLYAHGTLDELDAVIAAEHPGRTAWELAEQRERLHEDLAEHLAEAGDEDGVKKLVAEVLKFFNDELGRECGGAGGHAARMALDSAEARMKKLIERARAVGKA
jgi:hypothetical protein